MITTLAAWGAAIAGNKAKSVLIFLAVFTGVLFHWIYLMAVQAIKNNGEWQLGNEGLILARVIVSLVAAIAAFAGIYRQVSGSDSFQVATAFTLGLSVDALTAPWTQNTPAS